MKNNRLPHTIMVKPSQWTQYIIPGMCTLHKANVNQTNPGGWKEREYTKGQNTKPAHLPCGKETESTKWQAGGGLTFSAKRGWRTFQVYILSSLVSIGCGSMLKVNQKCGDFLSEGQGEGRQITHEMELIVLSAPAWFFSHTVSYTHLTLPTIYSV